MVASEGARKRGAIYAGTALVAAAGGFYLSGLGPALMSTGKYLPHGVCYTWQPNLIALHLVSDILIGLAYVSIPVTLLYFIRKRTDLPFNWMFVLFGVFIVACGATHWMEVWTLWYPQYWLAGSIKAITAAASVPTAILLVMLVPKALAIPSVRQLQDARDALQSQVQERVRAEEALRRAHASLEERVAERTAELARANAVLEQQRVQLTEADKRKDEFLAILSHELRNPLHAIATASSVLDSAAPERLAVAKQIIKRQVAQLARLLDDLLDVSRIASGKMRLTMEALDAKTAVLAALDSVERTIEERRLVFKLELPEKPLYVHADPTRLEQIVSNLLSNAVKYTDPGAKVTLNARAEGNEVLIAVKDEGIGIHPDDLPHLFQLFAQGRTAQGRSGAGLGIGLHLARELAKLHDGTISVKSEGPGRGSEFVLRLPLVPPPAPAEARAAPTDAAPVRALRIVVVDDNRDAAQSLAMLLQSDGHTTAIALDGPSGVEAIRAFEPDVALVDIGLPGFDGYEVARRVRASEGGKSVLLVAITGWGQQSDKARALEAGFDHHITKPLEYSGLHSILSNARPRRRQTRNDRS